MEQLGLNTPGARSRLHGGTSSKVHSTRDKHYRILKTDKQEKQIGDENEIIMYFFCDLYAELRTSGGLSVAIKTL